MTSHTAPSSALRRDRAAASAARRVRRRTGWYAAGFLLPFGSLFLAMMVAPIGYAVYQSLFKVHRGGLLGGDQRTVFAGFANFTAAFKDDAFLSSLSRVAVLGVFQVPFMLGLALVIALLLDSRSARFKNAFRLTFFLPYALPGAIAAIMWTFLLVKDLSPFTGSLAAIGVHTDFVDHTWFPVSVGNMITWGWTGYNMLIIYSALQAIPAEVTEAAVLDGCSGWRMARLVKIPMVRPALVLTAVFSIIGTSQLFTEPAVMYAARISGGPSSDFTPIMNTTKIASQGDQNLASAEAIILALITLVLSFGFLKFTQRRMANP